MTDIFSQKLDGLPRTIEIRDDAVIRDVAAAMVAGAALAAMAIGSGGSLAAASYFATCRRDVSSRPTTIFTPMEFVLGHEDLADTEVWLFTGRGENADILAALGAAKARNAREVRVVTSNLASPVLTEISSLPHTKGYVLPVADEKDGFLSTHSLVAAVTCLLLATDAAVEADDLAERGAALSSDLRRRLEKSSRLEFARRFQDIKGNDTIILLADPTLAAAAVTIETSVWEAALCTLQRTDFRNFAHGRHVWLSQRGPQTFILAMTAELSFDIWTEIGSFIPGDIRVASFDYSAGGRREAALAIMDALLIVEAIGAVRDIDPGKPGPGAFAKPIYEGRALADLSARLNPSVRHKLDARRRRNLERAADEDFMEAYGRMLARMRAADFRALVLDYDGTIVATENRFAPPAPKITEELVRLLAAGVPVGIASGRGGSAAEMLRQAIPSEHQPMVIMGYYNGGYVQPLNVDIRDYPAPTSPTMVTMRAWLEESCGVPASARVNNVQLSIDLDSLVDPGQFLANLRRAPLVQSGEIRLVQSKHSIDIGLRSNNKRNVISHIAHLLGEKDVEPLCVGDSGHAVGNDFELLGQQYGLSVDQVCHRANVCWSLFGAGLRGPKALFKILQAIRVVSNGTFRLDIAQLTGPIRQ
ncbi:hypothetical protein NKI61_01655 [Mesorhizobium sp. M0514]|uniref:hypothetical protein n=1 Tax=Mesorhizobium sp. M0514 TaxID=2956955 RepID=UPI00333C1B7F